MIYHTKKGGSLGVFLFFLLLILGGAGAYYLLRSPAFETQKPSIVLPQNSYWNTHRPLTIKISDDTGLKNIIAYLTNGKERVKVADITFKQPTKSYDLKIKYPKIGFEENSERLKLILHATDISKWNLLKGNTSTQEMLFLVDNQKPDLFSLITSYGITKGGAALAIFKATDKNLKELYVDTNFGKRFQPTPFYKKGYYAVLLAWPMTQKRFNAKIVAIDKAGNKSFSRISLYLKNRRYRISHMKAKQSFIDGKIADLAEDRPEETQQLSPTDKLRYINETYRQENDALIKEITSKVDTNLLKDFSLQPFYPLKNAKVVGSFGDHRYYYYQDENNTISESYHLGIDLASVRRGEIRSSNPGVVVFANYNGIYGNNLIVYHGFGLYTVYGHCSTLLKKRGDVVRKGEVIARTGATGLALGDHLHFSTMVQGIFVRPAEWMDSKWIKTNITDVIQSAKKMIDK